MARATYLNKIIDSPEDLTPTLSNGPNYRPAVSLNIPLFRGASFMLFELLSVNSFASLYRRAQ